MKTLKLFFAALLLLLPLSAGAESVVFDPVYLHINSENGRYAKGDTVKVYAELSGPVGQNVRMTIVAAGKKIQDEALNLVPGQSTLVHTCVWDEPKSVIVNVFGESDPKKATSIGYIVAPEEFTPGYKEPDDLMEYWQAQIKKMRKSKIKAKMTPVTEDYKYSDKIACFDLEINMPEGNPVRAYVAMPKGAAAGSLPISMLAHGAGVNKPSNRSNVKTAVSLARLGAIGIDINAHGMLNDQPQSYYDDLYNGALSKYSVPVLTTKDDYYFRLMYLRLVRALDYLTKLPEWDGKRVLVQGSSQGGGQSAALAGIDSRVTAAVMIVPAINDLGGYLQKRPNGWPVKHQYRKGEQKELAAQILPYFDGALLIRHSKAKLFYEAGLVDITCDPACVFASYNNAGSTDKQIVTFPYRAHATINKRYVAAWKAACEKPKTDFIKAYLK